MACKVTSFRIFVLVNLLFCITYNYLRVLLHTLYSVTTITSIFQLLIPGTEVNTLHKHLAAQNISYMKPKAGFIISSPFRDKQKPLIFQWVFTLRNAGIGLGSIPAFRSVNPH